MPCLHRSTRTQVIRLSFVLPPPGEGAVLPRLLTLACLLIDLVGSYRLSPGEQGRGPGLSTFNLLHEPCGLLAVAKALGCWPSPTPLAKLCMPSPGPHPRTLPSAEQQKRATDARSKREAAARASEQASRLTRVHACQSASVVLPHACCRLDGTLPSGRLVQADRSSRRR